MPVPHIASLSRGGHAPAVAPPRRASTWYPPALGRALGIALAASLSAASVGYAQQAPLERLPSEQLDARSPSVRVSGAPGAMTIRDTSCRTVADPQVRRRIVDIAVQEWAFFGFRVVDQTRARPRVAGRRLGQPGFGGDGAPTPVSRRGFRWLDAEESARVASSIGGYWAVTPEGGWILGNQNKAWAGPDGVAARWRDPWSAAFVSWVICESGLAATSRFQRAVAHHVYIDQAIRARDDTTSQAAYVAYDIGERVIEPGDLLCSGRRPEYRSLADRRRQMGEGARTHCDFVVKVDEAAGRIMAIGGNVRGTVSLKLLPAVRRTNGTLTPGRDEEEDADLFAHLKLRTGGSIRADALDHSPTLRSVACTVDERGIRQRNAPPVGLAC
jgi:hypothetical protein